MTAAALDNAEVPPEDNTDATPATVFTVLTAEVIVLTALVIPAAGELDVPVDAVILPTVVVNPLTVLTTALKLFVVAVIAPVIPATELLILPKVLPTELSALDAPVIPETAFVTDDSPPVTLDIAPVTDDNPPVIPDTAPDNEEAAPARPLSGDDADTCAAAVAAEAAAALAICVRFWGTPALSGLNDSLIESNAEVAMPFAWSINPVKLGVVLNAPNAPVSPPNPPVNDAKLAAAEPAPIAERAAPTAPDAPDVVIDCRLFVTLDKPDTALVKDDAAPAMPDTTPDALDRLLAILDKLETAPSAPLTAVPADWLIA